MSESIEVQNAGAASNFPAPPKLQGPLMARVATAPISWGICEVPNWGEQLPADRVAQEMADCGFAATELGEHGFFPSDPDDLLAYLAPFNLQMIGGFVSLIMHEPNEEEATLAQATEVADFFQAAGATHFNSAAITDAGWSGRKPLSDSQWEQLSRMLEAVGGIAEQRGLRHVLHPHVNTVIETGDEILRVLESTSVDFVLDTAHFAVGGCDPLAFAQDHSDRVGLVHLKDLVHDVAEELNAGNLNLLEAVQAGMFQPLGRGDLPIADVVDTLERSGYDDWYVLEQDVALTTGVPPVGTGPVEQIELSLDYLRSIEAERLGSPGGESR